MRVSRSEIATTMSAVAAGGDRVVYEREQKGRTGGALMCACVLPDGMGAGGSCLPASVCVCVLCAACGIGARRDDTQERETERERRSTGILEQEVV